MLIATENLLGFYFCFLFFALSVYMLAITWGGGGGFRGGGWMRGFMNLPAFRDDGQVTYAWVGLWILGEGLIPVVYE